MTRLQGYLVALKNLRAAALDELTDRELETLIGIECDAWGMLAARLYLDEWLNQLTADEDAEAA